MMKSFFVLAVSLVATANAYLQADTGTFVSDFPNYVARAYTALEKKAPKELRDACTVRPYLATTEQVVVASAGSTVSASEVQAQCGTSKICVLEGKTLQMDSSLVVYALIVRNGGKVLWTDSIQKTNDIWLCAGYVAVELGGTFDMDLQDEAKTGWIFISNNGAIHTQLRARSFGGAGSTLATDIQPVIKIKGRIMSRTWSLLEVPLAVGATSMKLSHNPIDMGWKVGDRIAVAPTDDRSQGAAQSFSIAGFGGDGTISLSAASTLYHEASKITSPNGNVVFRSAEVINLSRNVIITGDDFTEVPCDETLTEAFPGFGTSTQGCMCTANRRSCTMGLHTVHMNGGVSQIENVRVEKCGQRGVEGKYCLHFHHLRECPTCLYKNNAIEFSQQRGLIIHGTHRALADSNVLYDVRGAALYVEDGNEILNTLAYNVAICPWKFKEQGCTLPGTSNDQSDTSLNQAGLYTESPTNDLIGNRMANHFNGMLLNAHGGRGAARGKACTNQMPLGRWEGNTYHSSGRFGTYTLNNNYPLQNTGSSVATNGLTSKCESFTPDGGDNGLSTAIFNNFDYGNAFVGHYEAGDIQYSGHTSFKNLNNIYWKETKSFADGCSAHITNSYILKGTMALPDSLGSFIIENTKLEDVLMEANHHCGIGVTGFLCMPNYVLHNVAWVDGGRSTWVAFTQSNDAGSGGIFSLSREDAALNAAGTGGFFLPKSYQSLVSSVYPYLLATGVCDSATTLGLAKRYENGILCKAPLRALKVYSKVAGASLLVQVWKASNTAGAPIAEQYVPFYSSSSWKQGYKFPVIPGPDYFYRISLSGSDVPADWIIDFGDRTISNRWGVDEIKVEIKGRACGGTIRSDHDRRFISADSMLKVGLGWGHGACTAFPPTPLTTCSSGSPVAPVPLPPTSPTAPSTEPIAPSTEPIASSSTEPTPSMAPAPVAFPIAAPSPVVSPIAEPSSGTSMPCEGVCKGTWPFGCNVNLKGKVNYMCYPKGGCYYATKPGDFGKARGYCVFKGANVEE